MALSYVSHLARRTVIDTRLRDDRIAGGRDFVEFGELLALGALSLTGLGVIAPAGAGPGIGGTGLSLTSGAGGGGDAQGGDFLITLGQGSGLGRSGMFIISSTATVGTSDHVSQNISAAMLIEQIYTPAQNDVGGSVEGLEVHLTTKGDGSRVQGVSTEAVEFLHFWQATGAQEGHLVYGGEATFSQDAESGSVGVAVGWQGNIRSMGAGALTNANGIRAGCGPFSGAVGTLRGYGVGLSLAGAGAISHLIGYDSSGFTQLTSDGISLAGGTSVTGFQAAIPSQGGNLSGSITNIGMLASATLSGGGGGTPGLGGVVDNCGVALGVPSGAGFGSGTGRTYNQGIHITGNGGTGSPGAGGVHNWALLSDSTAPSGLAGSLMLGITNHQSLVTANALQLADSWNVVLGTASGSMLGTGPTQKLGIWGATPAAQQVLATGAGKTVDNVIALLQSIGLARQS